MRIAMVLAAALLGATCLADTEHAQAAVQHYQLNIPRQTLDTALEDLAQQTGMQIGRFSDRIDGSTMVGPVEGARTPAEALTILLRDTGLDYKIVGDTTFAVFNPKAINSIGKLDGKGPQAANSQRILSASAGPIYAGLATAQTEEAPQTAPQAQEQGGLQEILVTAQRRSQVLLDVPMAVTALGSAQLQSAGITTTTDLTQVTPNLQVINSSGNDLLFLRGIGTSNATTTSEPSIAFYVDDVYYPDAGSALTTLQNVERVEVLAGPQGTLYGRNATGGLIRVVTLDPQQEPLVKARVGYESYATITGSLYATGGLSDNLAASIEADVHHQGNGFGTNPALGDEINFVKTQNFMAKILWTPGDADRITVAGRYYKNTSDFDLYFGAFPGTVTVTGQGYTGDPYDVNANIKMRPQTTSTDGSVAWQHKFGNDLTFKSVSAYHDARWSAPDADLTASVPTLANASQTIDLNSYQQEFLLQGTAHLFPRPLDFTTGLFYFRSSRDYGIQLTFLPPIGPLEQDTYARITTRSYAGFGQVDYHLTDRDTLTAGARYTYEKLGDDTAEFINVVRAASIQQDVNSHNASWRLALSHKLTDDWMVYASASTGYKSGTFNAQLLTPDTQFVRPETLYAYEVGSKVEFLDRRVQLNASVFYYDYKNLQVEGIANNTIFLQNAATARPYGAELQSVFALPVPVGDLQLRGNLSYLHARYSNFRDCSVNLPNPSGGNTTTTGNCSGNQLEYAPTLSGTVSANYKVPVKKLGGFIGAGVTFYHSNPFYSEPSNINQLSAHDLLNAELFYSLLDDRARVRVYGTNLTNRQYLITVTDSLETAGFPSPPRIVGIEFEYSWR